MVSDVSLASTAEHEKNDPELPFDPLHNPSDVTLFSRTERYQSIDALRGLAVLGILLMNIPLFALPQAYAGNPSLPEGSSSINIPYWFVGLLFFEGKMRCLFSMLFGAGCVLLTSRADQRGAAVESGDIYYRRTILLMFIGLLHAYFLWDGDILFWYGALGLFLFPLRRLSGTSLLIVGLLLAAITIPQGYYREYTQRTMQTKAVEAEAAAKAGQTLTEEQTAARIAWQAVQRSMRPPTDQEIEKQIKEYQTDYVSIFQKRAKQLLDSHGNSLYLHSIPDVLCFMVIGMGLFKLGVFTAQRSSRFYVVLAIVSYGIGLPLTAYFGKLLMESNYLRSLHVLFIHFTYNLDRLAIALGHTALLMLIYQKGWLTWLTSRLAAVGQMALTNYLMHSLICTSLFYGYGLGLYGKLQLHELLYVVLAIWLVQLLLSPIWLRYFRFGPVEWLWRSLTYLRWQPLVRASSTS